MGEGSINSFKNSKNLWIGCPVFLMGKKFVRAGEELEDWMVEESL